MEIQRILSTWLTKELAEKNSYSTRSLAYMFIVQHPEFNDIDIDILRTEIAKRLNSLSY